MISLKLGLTKMRILLLNPSSCFGASIYYLHSSLLFTHTQSFGLLPFLEDLDSVIHTRNKTTNKIAKVFENVNFVIILTQSEEEL